jgi:hypothetical protein
MRRYISCGIHNIPDGIWVARIVYPSSQPKTDHMLVWVDGFENTLRIEKMGIAFLNGKEMDIDDGEVEEQRECKGFGK